MQELISNSIKHGKAELIDILIRLNSEDFHLQYKDDGQGFDTKKLANKKGLGLKSMESRLNMIQAQIQYQSEIGKGVIVDIYLKN